MRFTRQTVCLLAVLSLASIVSAVGEEDAIDFVRDVRPIFELHCYECHAGDVRASGLRLDVKSVAMKGGDNHGPDILPGRAQESPLVRFITTDDDNHVMPPSGPMSAQEIATLIRWIDQGASWPDGVDRVTLKDTRDHWSFKPLSVSPAAVGIDAFIAAKLEELGLEMAPPAARAEWIRRVSFDLTGLPPTFEQVVAFSRDERVDAYERVVDDLLSSPDYGQRWAQHWLDVVRYADTHGFEVNTERPHAWPYRDYVIQAFNNDTPYDRFIREQLTGDQLGEDAATGFLVTASVLLPGQIGKDAPSIRLARQDAIDEIVNNISQTFLGLSVGCARCHDHKFDPISSQDYYAMQAIVAGVEYDQRPWSTSANPPTPKVFAGVFRIPDDIRLLHRGDPEQPLEAVAPAILSAFGDRSLPIDADDVARRVFLADWLVEPSNPLTARVMVNRIWQGHFGTGLVGTPSDFGNSGSQPSHPELLDFLATEFIRSGWSIKRMHRLIVLSQTYRQSSRIRDDFAAIDADNQYLWRFPARRLEAESIRDSILAVSGRLVRKLDGRGFDLFNQRGGLSGFVPVESFQADGLRRMIYAHKVRRESEAVFGAFDCPDAGQSTAVRTQSTTPLQALNLFNSRFTIDQAEALAQRVTGEVGADPARQIGRAFEHALQRVPDDDELAACLPIVQQHGLALLCRVLFNSNEFLFIP